MSSIDQTIEFYQNQGALLGIGSNQIVSFTNFQASVAGEAAVDDTNNDDQWDFGETATINGDSASLTATGTAAFGVTISVPPLVNLTINLSSPVPVGVFEVDGTQYLRYYNADGTDADPAALLDGLTNQVISALGPLLGPVQAIIGPIAAYVENNTLLNFDLNNADGMQFTCFTLGTLILTDCGERPIETLAVGDRVLTVDHGLQPIRWIGRRTLSPDELDRAANLVPVRIAAGALGSDLPRRTLTVSPQHRCLVRSAIAERMFGAREVLVAAKHLLDLPGVSLAPASAPVTYLHLLFDRHELVCSNGLISESFYTGDQALTAVGQAARAEILALFPELASGLPTAARCPARTFLRGRVARKLVERSVRNQKPLVEPPQLTGPERQRFKV